MKNFEHILIATDFEEPSLYALDVAMDLATRFESELTVLHTWEILSNSYSYAAIAYNTLDIYTPLEEAASTKLEQTMERVRARLPRAKSLLLDGRPWEKILAAIESTKADLVVVGTHGRKGLSHVVLGSVAEKVVRMSPIPVLVVRR